MTYPNQPPRPGPPPGGFRPGPPPAPATPAPVPQGEPQYRQDGTGGTGHPAVDAVLQSLANAAALSPSDQIAEYEAAHQVLQETLAGIDR